MTIIAKIPNTISLNRKSNITNRHKYIILLIYALSFIAFGFLMDTPGNIYKGLYSIMISPDILITDYIEVGGIGACFVNSGIVTLASIVILYFMKLEINGRAIIAVFLMSGFALFGKNIFNVWLIVFGVFLYSKLKKEKFRDYIYTALLGTSMAPTITEILLFIDQPFWIRIILTLIIGTLIGFVLPPVTAHVMQFHQGYNLYNVGFAAGIIGTIIVSLSISYGYNIRSYLLWSTKYDIEIGVFLCILFTVFILYGFIINGKSLHGIGNILKSSGKLSCDYVEMEGFGASLINMGMNGFISMGFILALGGPLNGPTTGGILTIVGFGAYGKHVRNMTPIFIGVLLGIFTKIWGMSDPRLLMVALFGTALAPIAGEFGWKYGVLAGFINSSVVLSVGILHGGMNLYNTGFSSGIVAAIMVPVIRALHKRKHSV